MIFIIALIIVERLQYFLSGIFPRQAIKFVPQLTCRDWYSST